MNADVKARDLLPQAEIRSISSAEIPMNSCLKDVLDMFYSFLSFSTQNTYSPVLPQEGMRKKIRRINVEYFRIILSHRVTMFKAFSSKSTNSKKK